MTQAGAFAQSGFTNLDIAKGLVDGHAGTTKFGRSTNVDNGVATDIWDKTTSQPIWLAPTDARIHTISSTSAADVSGGTGTTTINVSYLADWDTPEATETVSGNLNAGIAMTNAAVIIHRMQVVPQSTSTTPNAGTISAVAAVDGTTTAQILPGSGQTQMAIYGVPDGKTFYIGRFYGNLIGAAGGDEVSVKMLVNPNPDIQTTNFLTKHTFGVRGGGTSALTINYYVIKTIPGPAIIKIQGTADSNDMDVSAGFDGVLVDD